MSPSRLTPHDANVLEKIKDPESTAATLLVDNTLPRDPNITDSVLYASIVVEENAIINSILDLQRKEVNRVRGRKTDTKYLLTDDDDEQRSFRTSQLAGWLSVIFRLDKLIEKHPNYSSALNNRAQAMKMVYGEGVLVKLCTPAGCPVNDMLPALDPYTVDFQDLSLMHISRKILSDLNDGIFLLSPRTAFAAVSPTQAKTLSQLYMQRGVLYRATAKKLALNGSLGTVNDRMMNGGIAHGIKLEATLRNIEPMKEAMWSSIVFEEAASRDFMMAGRYGNEIGKGLAVSTNPTAKLCGEMVKEAMRKEYACGIADARKKENLDEAPNGDTEIGTVDEFEVRVG